MDYRSVYPRILRWQSSLIDLCLVIGGLAIISLVFINAFLRGAAGFDLAWSLEVTAFLLLWTTFLGCAAAVARGAHMRVSELVESLFSDAIQKWLSLAIDIIISVVLISLIVMGYSISAHTWAQNTTVLYWPVGLLYASMPVGMALSLIFHLFNIYYDFFKPNGPQEQPPQLNESAESEIKL